MVPSKKAEGRRQQAVGGRQKAIDPAMLKLGRVNSRQKSTKRKQQTKKEIMSRY